MGKRNVCLPGEFVFPSEAKGGVANEDTLLLMMILGWANVSRTQNIGFVSIPRKRGKMFLTKIRNIFCVSDTNFFSLSDHIGLALRYSQEKLF